MSSVELINKTELTSIAGTESIYVQEAGSPYTVKRALLSTVKNWISGLYIGESMQIFYSYKPISSTFPWLCMSLPDQTISTANFSQDLIDVFRTRKVVYDEFNTAVSAFSGAWSGSNFTLDNNAANVAMITELYEDWLFAGSPASGWRILVSNNVEYNITGFTVASRIITVSGSPTGTSIEIYLNRILNSTTSAKHFSWAGLGLYMTGQNKITGLRRRDKLQGFKLESMIFDGGIRGVSAGGTGTNTAGQWRYDAGATNNTNDIILTGAFVTDGANGTPRTGTKTEIESATAMLYLYVGSYTP